MLEDLLVTINSFIPDGSAMGQQLPPEALPLPMLVGAFAMMWWLRGDNLHA